MDGSKSYEVFKKIEMPLIPVLSAMEMEGIKIDIDALADFSKELEQKIVELNDNVQQLAGTPFNLASPKQLGQILFEHMKLVDKPKKTKTGQYSTSEDTLLKLKGKHAIIDDILEFRQLQKLKSTYVDALPELADADTHRIHTTYQQAVAATGRLSSVNPNLQNIPIRSEKVEKYAKPLFLEMKTLPYWLPITLKLNYVLWHTFRKMRVCYQLSKMEKIYTPPRQLKYIRSN